MRLSHIVTLSTKTSIVTLCKKRYLKALLSKKRGVYAQKCPDCMNELKEENWFTLTINSTD